ncbi:MAG: cupredoxin domain-containing protein [Nitrospirota bacterium]
MRHFRIWLMIGLIGGMIGAAARPLPAQQAGARIDITIKNFTFQSQAKVLPLDQPVTIHLRNLDAVEHGFVSPMLRNADIVVETAAGTTFGRGIEGVHIAPGKEVSIHFASPPPGQHPFQCDLHPNMKGELFLLSVGSA